MKKELIIYPLLFTLITSCKSSDTNLSPVDNTSYIPPSNMVTVVNESIQRDGNSSAGYNYLINGDYINSGIPYTLYKKYGVFLDGVSKNELNRTGDASVIPYFYNLVTANNGVKVVAPTCLKCHASNLNNEFIIGLGETTADYTTPQSIELYDSINKSLSKEDSIAFSPFYQSVKKTSAYIVTSVVGVNPADRLFDLLSLNRDNKTFIWNGKAEAPKNLYPTDVPAWWLLKKKHSMFTPAIGTGDFARIMTASSTLTLKDTSEARKIDSHFPDIYAYIKSITPPKYKQTINQSLVTIGQKVFINKCSSCHGTYESGNVTYPNYIINAFLIGTDTYALRDDYHKKFVNWYNSSWYANDKYAAKFEIPNGYLAPPLDGVWATAPYLHNGSVPTIEDLLNSSQRPKYWRRKIINNAIDNTSLDYVKVGWQYTTPTTKEDKYTYDTTLPGYGNQGHTFGDGLSTSDRNSLIEYLKTL